MNNIAVKKTSKNDIPVILGLLELERPKPEKDKDGYALSFTKNLR